MVYPSGGVKSNKMSLAIRCCYTCPGRSCCRVATFCGSDSVCLPCSPVKLLRDSCCQDRVNTAGSDFKLEIGSGSKVGLGNVACREEFFYKEAQNGGHVPAFGFTHSFGGRVYSFPIFDSLALPDSGDAVVGVCHMARIG